MPVVAWLSSTAASAIRLCGPQEIGGLGDLDARIEAEVQRTGKPAEEIREKVHNSSNYASEENFINALTARFFERQMEA